MGSFPSRARFETAVAAANALLARHGYRERGTAAELEAWLRTDTPYPNPDPADLLDAPFLVVHEVVEIAEVQRRGLPITQDVIVRNLETVNDAHWTASEAEFRIAAAEDQVEYVASRFADLEGWCDDPVLTASQRAAYVALRDRVAGWLEGAKRGQRTEGL